MRDVDEVGRYPVDDGRHDALHIGECESSGRVLVGAHPNAHAHVWADLVPDRTEHLDGEPHPVRFGSAVVVGALVRRWRQELLEEVAVADVDLESVEAGGEDVPGADDVPVYHGLDVRVVHHMGSGRRCVPCDRRWAP